MLEMEKSMKFNFFTLCHDDLMVLQDVSWEKNEMVFYNL